jgi:phosphoribosylformylglycinamidine cyclo-ligase
VSERYEAAGVKDQGGALAAVARHLGPTLENASVLTGPGHYAAVLRVAEDLAVAISTDGVGTKTMVASALDRYDTIGFDCVAMNVNDVLCVGARPLALVDYVGVNTLDGPRADALLEGLAAAAQEARIAIPGGEIAQLPEVIGSDGRSPGDARAFDLVGTCIGTLRPSDLTLGDAIRPGDALVGIASSGIHSNGLTLARRALRDAGYRLDDHVAALGRTLGEELLVPTAIYARPVGAVWDEGIETRGLAHITGDGLANLGRLSRRVGFIVDRLPPPPPIFGLIQAAASIADQEMYRVFNMGIGFVLVVPAETVERTVACIGRAGHHAVHIGWANDDAGTVVVGSPDAGAAPSQRSTSKLPARATQP